MNLTADQSFIDKVKNDLPEVKVVGLGKSFSGQVQGRKLKYAVVVCDAGSFQFAWETVANAVLNNRPLKI